MRVDLPDNSFTLTWEKVKAWYNPGGTVREAVYIRTIKGRQVNVAVSVKHTKVLGWLEDRGKAEVALLARGVLKRKTQ